MLRKGLVVTDVVYNPQKSKLLAQAEEAGCTVINGLGMMLWQGALGFKLFTGEDICQSKKLKKLCLVTKNNSKQ